MTPRPRRVGYSVTSLLIDIFALALTFQLAPLTWEHPEATAPVAVPIGLFGLLGTFLSGGYRVTAPIRPSASWSAALGLVVGLGSGWLLLRLVSQKAGLYDLIPPAIEGFSLATAALGLVTFAHRRLHLHHLATVEERSPIGLLASEDPAPLIAELRRRRFSGPIEVLPPRDLDDTDLGRLRALLIAAPLDDLSRPDLERIAQAKALGLPVSTRARFFEEHFRLTPLRTSDDPWLLLDESLVRRSALYLSTKRLIDVLGASLLLVLAALPLLVAAIAIKLDSRGPVVYRQTRAGLHRRPFTLYKLRTMIVDAEPNGPCFAASDDPRVTRVGRFLRKTRFDEIPQLLNILKNEMSLIGPRPERPELDQSLAPFIPYYQLRHLTKPGLTGWAQVKAGYTDSPDSALTKLEHDVYYLKNASIAFDLEILAATIPVVLHMRGR